MLRPLTLFKNVARCSRSCTFGARLFTQVVPRQTRSLSKPLLWGAASAFTAALVLQQATTTVHLDAPQTTKEDPCPNLVDPATSIEFPKELRIPSRFPLPLHSLVGVGVRTVSFLGIKVYSVGFYADLANPKLHVPITASPEEKIDHIIRNTSCVIRIVPTRNTSYSHLRDGFIRALNARLQLARSRGTLSPETELAVQSPLRKLKSIFPTTAVAKGYPLDVHLTAPTGDPTRPRSLVFLDLGSVESDWVAQEFVLAYFEGDGISPPLKKSTVERLETFGN
ncbi:chalcone-flavanone isomerase-domain-containing protein [Melanogaster broomeanus]|nr:chalcone-flavanone isomerase-domain-containing protein [Melanogaster broomeanus]